MALAPAAAPRRRFRPIRPKGLTGNGRATYLGYIGKILELQGNPMRVTLEQIAQRCGVSRQAVSRILGGHVERFSPQTCRRVEQVARELNYQPDPIGRALVGGRTMSIGLLTHGVGGRVPVARLQALMEMAQAAGYETYLRTTGRGTNDTERLTQAVRSLVARRVDGLIITRSVPIAADARRFFESLSVPTVFINRGPPQYNARVNFDAQSAINALAEHLAELGHRHAAFFASTGSADFLEHKIHPYQRAFARAGIEATTVLEQAPQGGDGHDALRGINAEQRSYEAVQQYIADGGTATAWCMNNDESAIGALAAAREAGLRVPDDVSLVGFDDLALARFCDPPLTTIRTPRDEVSEAAFNMLERLMREPDAPVEPLLLSYELIVRTSTGPAPHANRQPVS